MTTEWQELETKLADMRDDASSLREIWEDNEVLWGYHSGRLAMATLALTWVIGHSTRERVLSEEEGSDVPA